MNSDTTGNQYAPTMAIKGDTVYVVWLDTRSGQVQVYLRSFTADRITGVEEPGPVNDFMMLEVSPNPVRSAATIRYQIPDQFFQSSGGRRDRGSMMSLHVYDALGRIVHRIAAC